MDYSDADVAKAIRKAIEEANTCDPELVCYKFEELFPELADVITYSMIEEELLAHEQDV